MALKNKMWIRFITKDGLNIDQFITQGDMVKLPNGSKAVVILDEASKEAKQSGKK